MCMAWINLDVIWRYIGVLVAHAMRPFQAPAYVQPSCRPSRIRQDLLYPGK